MKLFPAIAFMVASSLCFALGSILIKVLGSPIIGTNLNPLQIVQGRFFFAFIFLILVSFFIRFDYSFRNIKLNFLRSIFGWLGVTIWFTSILYIPISDATAINFLNPIFAMFFASIILKEKVGSIRWIAATISLFGGLLLIRPSSDLSLNPIAILCLLGAIIMGLEIICIKLLSGRDTVFKILMLSNFFAMVLSSLWLPFVFTMPSLIQLSLMAFIGLLFVIGQFSFLNSMKRADASFVMPFFYITLVFVIIFDYLVFQSFPDEISFIGAAIIITGALIISYKEWKSKFSEK